MTRTKFETAQQIALRDVPRGEFVRRKLDARRTFTRQHFDHATRTYCLSDYDDLNREIYLRGSTTVWVGFDY